MKWLKCKTFAAKTVMYIQVSHIVRMFARDDKLIIICTNSSMELNIHKDYKIMSELAVLEEVQNASV